MKNQLLITVILITLSFVSFDSRAAKSKRLKYDSLSCLQIEGFIANAGDGTDDECTVELIGPGDAVDTILLKGGKRKFRFVLNKNSYYAIRVSKKGYLSKLVSVNTDLLSMSDDIHVFEFETSLIKEEAIHTLNKDILDFPVAIIHYDYEINSFSYNKEYSAFIKKELHNVKPSPVKKSSALSPISNRVFASVSN